MCFVVWNSKFYSMFLCHDWGVSNRRNMTGWFLSLPSLPSLPRTSWPVDIIVESLTVKTQISQPIFNAFIPAICCYWIHHSTIKLVVCVALSSDSITILFLSTIFYIHFIFFYELPLPTPCAERKWTNTIPLPLFRVGFFPV